MLPIDASVSASASSSSATGATNFAPVNITNGIGGSSGGSSQTWLIVAVLVLAWFVFFRKKK